MLLFASTQMRSMGRILSIVHNSILETNEKSTDLGTLRIKEACKLQECEEFLSRDKQMPGSWFTI